MLGAIMFTSKLIMEALPNIHLVGMFTMLLAITYRLKGIIPIYIYAMLCLVYMGFSPWWIPNLYTWAVLFFVTLMLPKNMPRSAAFIVYPVICSLHGLAYGILCAPVQAVAFGLNFEGTVAWIIAGLPFDITHAVGNLVTGLLIVPLAQLLKRLYKLYI